MSYKEGVGKLWHSVEQQYQIDFHGYKSTFYLLSMLGLDNVANHSLTVSMDNHKHVTTLRGFDLFSHTI